MNYLDSCKTLMDFKKIVRKNIGDRGSGSKGPLTDLVLKTLHYYKGDDANTEILLKEWHASLTPLVLKCLIDDALHKYKRQKELGPLPDFYIPPQKQNHPHRQLEGKPKIGHKCTRCKKIGSNDEYFFNETWQNCTTYKKCTECELNLHKEFCPHPTSLCKY
jgi:hypothetical protein